MLRLFGLALDSYRILNDGNSLDANDADAVRRNRSVILHDPDINASGGQGTPFGHYIYRFSPNPGSGNLVENRRDEAMASFMTVYGPTLADGDDYDLTGNAETLNGEPRNVYHGVGSLRPTDENNTTLDDWDVFRSSPDTAGPDTAGDGSINSIAEVEEAIRIGRQSFVGFYVDTTNAFGSNTSLSTWYFGLFPTKTFYAENPEILATIAGGGFVDYLDVLVPNLLDTRKFVAYLIWDIFGEGIGEVIACSGCIPSPIESSPTLDQSLAVFNISFIKNEFPVRTATFESGRVAWSLIPSDPFVGGLNPLQKLSWPGLLYSFDASPDFSVLGHWRRLQR